MQDHGWLGWVAIGVFALHAGNHLYQGHGHDVLWACHVSSLVVGVGYLLRSPSINAVGVLWLAVGMPLWIVYLVGGGESEWSSWLTHVAGVAIGGLGIRRMGMPAGTWWKALAGLIVLGFFCRWVTPAAANVNLSHAVWQGWERRFPSYPVYLLGILAGTAAILAATEWSVRRLVK